MEPWSRRGRRVSLDTDEDHFRRDDSVVIAQGAVDEEDAVIEIVDAVIDIGDGIVAGARIDAECGHAVAGGGEVVITRQLVLAGAAGDQLKDRAAELAGVIDVDLVIPQFPWR